MIVTRGLGRNVAAPQSIALFGLGAQQVFIKKFPNLHDNDWMQERHDAQIAQDREEAEILAFINIFLMTRH